MRELDLYIERERILFYPVDSDTNLKILEIKYTMSGSSFKLQLPIFKEGSPEEFLHFLHKFAQAKQKLGYTSCQKLESGM